MTFLPSNSDLAGFPRTCATAMDALLAARAAFEEHGPVEEDHQLVLVPTVAPVGLEETEREAA